MRRLAIVLTVVASCLVVATFALAYASIFSHRDDLAGAAYLTMWADFLFGFGAGLAWSVPRGSAS